MFSPPWSGRCRPGRAAGMTPTSKNEFFFNGFSLYLGLKMNIFQKMKHESYSTFGELSNSFYRFLKFEFHQELWAKNSEILTLKSGFSFFSGSKINIFQKMKHQSYSTSWELSNAFYRFLKFEFHQQLWAKNSEILTLKSVFSFFFGSKINIFQKMKH